MVSEWRVVWVPDPGRWGSLPPDGVIGVKDLPTAVARIGLQPGDPVFVSPDFTVDLDLLDSSGRGISGILSGNEAELRDGHPASADIPVLAGSAVEGGH